MLSELPVRLAIIGGHFAAVQIAAAAKQGASMPAVADVDLAMNEIPAEWRTPISSSQETK